MRGFGFGSQGRGERAGNSILGASHRRQGGGAGREFLPEKVLITLPWAPKVCLTTRQRLHASTDMVRTE